MILDLRFVQEQFKIFASYLFPELIDGFYRSEIYVFFFAKALPMLLAKKP